VRRTVPPSVARSGEPRLRALDELLLLPRRSPLYPELATALRAAAALHGLVTDLEPVPVRPTATTRQSGCYRMREGDPIDLRVSRRHDRVPLSFLHEVGHLLDHQLAPQPRRFASPSHAAFRRWRELVRALPSRAPAHASRTHRRYFDSSREVWARSYAQTVLALAPDERLRDTVRRLQRAGDPFVWPEREEAAIAAAVLGVLERLELLRPAALAA
jgi:hypothetical protein